MVYRLQRLQVRKHRLQVIVSHVSDIPPRHEGTKAARSDFSSAHDANEGVCVVVRDSGGVICKVGRRFLDLAEVVPAGKFESG
jgi:hypothetical protein